MKRMAKSVLGVLIAVALVLGISMTVMANTGQISPLRDAGGATRYVATFNNVTATYQYTGDESPDAIEAFLINHANGADWGDIWEGERLVFQNTFGISMTFWDWLYQADQPTTFGGYQVDGPFLSVVHVPVSTQVTLLAPQAPAAPAVGDSWIQTWVSVLSDNPHEEGMMSFNNVEAGSTFVFDTPGIYQIYTAGVLQSSVDQIQWRSFSTIYVVVGGTGGAPRAPRLTAPPPQYHYGDTYNLRSTERLVHILPPAPVSGEDLLYVVQPGERLWSIAFNYYGSMRADAVNRIVAANAALMRETNNTIEAGMVLRLPARGMRDPIMRASLDGAAGVYLVRLNDTYADLAQHFYGDRNLWRIIRDANQGRLGPGNIIYDGQWIIIPHPPSE